MAGDMSKYSEIEATEPDGIGHRARLVLAIAAMLVLLTCVGVIEVGVLTAVSAVSSGRSHP